MAETHRGHQDQAMMFSLLEVPMLQRCAAGQEGVRFRCAGPAHASVNFLGLKFQQMM